MPVLDFKTFRYVKHPHSKRRKIDPVFFLVGFVCVNVVALLYFLYSQNAESESASTLDIPSFSKRWEYIIVHHGGGDTKRGDAASYDRFHRAKYNTGLLYHFVIGNGEGNSADGEIEIGFRWKEQIAGAHVSNVEYQENAIGICLVGDLNRFYPTQAQISKLIALVYYLMKQYEINSKNVYTHRELVSTACPGQLFPEERFFDTIRGGLMGLAHTVDFPSDEGAEEKFLKPLKNPFAFMGF